MGGGGEEIEIGMGGGRGGEGLRELIYPCPVSLSVSLCQQEALEKVRTKGRGRNWSRLLLFSALRQSSAFSTATRNPPPREPSPRLPATGFLLSLGCKPQPCAFASSAPGTVTYFPSGAQGYCF